MPPSPLSFEPWSGRAAELVLAQARALQTAPGRRGGPLLRGKQLGLLCDDAADPSALLFRRAADGLGAHVSLVRPLHEADASASFDDTARLLGRLYDAIECQGPAAALVQLLRERIGIPVFAGSASPEHPSARLAEQLEGSPDERRERVLQALLIVALS